MSDQAEIQGQAIGSKEEAWFAAALQKLDIPFIYQYAIKGGRNVRGGYVLDFLLPATAPQATGINLDNPYWHKKTGAEAFETTMIEQWCRTHGIRYILIPDENLDSVEAAVKIIRKDVL